MFCWKSSKFLLENIKIIISPTKHLFKFKLLINAKLESERDNTRMCVTYFNAYEMSKDNK